MSREFEVTDAVIEAMAECYDPTWGYSSADIGKEWAARSLAAALAHPSFRAQLRAWAAEEMRGLVAQPPDRVPVGKDYFDGGHNACRAETLANIERWEKDNEGQ